MELKKWLKLLLLIVGVEMVGGLSSLLAGDIKGDYYQLVKPPFSPPNWLFGIAWAVLYALIAIALFRVLERKSIFNKKAVGIFLLQLFINFCWSIVFFRFEQYWLSVVLIIILDAVVINMMLVFMKIDKLAASLIIPYIAWLFFATYLAIGCAILN